MFLKTKHLFNYRISGLGNRKVPKAGNFLYFYSSTESGSMGRRQCHRLSRKYPLFCAIAKFMEKFLHGGTISATMGIRIFLAARFPGAGREIFLSAAREVFRQVSKSEVCGRGGGS